MKFQVYVYYTFTRYYFCESICVNMVGKTIYKKQVLTALLKQLVKVTLNTI